MLRPIHRITVATDLSARSDRAVERAFQLGKAGDIPVEILMVLDDAMPEKMRASLHEKAISQLQSLADRWADGSPHSVNVQAGDPTQALVNACHDTDTLLIMGPHRPRPFLDALRETTMQRVVRRSPAPVLLVTEPVLSPYKRVLSLIDFHDAADHAFALASGLAPSARISPYHAVHVPYSGMLETTGSVQMDMQGQLYADAETQARSWHAAQDPQVADRLDEMTVAIALPEGMVQRATEGRAFDLITAGAHGAVGAARPLLGSVATDLMRNPPCDVLIGR